VAIADRRFAVERIRVAQGRATLSTDGRPVAIMAMGSPLSIETGVAETELRPWETALVPAAAAHVTFSAAGEALVVRVDPDLERLRVAAADAGVNAAVLDAFCAQFSGASVPA